MTITAEHLGALALHLAREHHRGRRLRRMGFGNRYVVQVTTQIRELVRVCGLHRKAACMLLYAAFKLARQESTQAIVFKGVQP